MSKNYQRRQFLKRGIGSLAGLSLFGLAACDSSNTTQGLASTNSMQPDTGTLNMFYWGSATRDSLTKQTLALFHQSDPAFSITSSFSDFNTYWTKLDAKIASDQIPDLIQMDMRYVANYVRQKRLLDLSQMIYNQRIDLSDYDTHLIDSCKVNNTVYGIPMGGNYQSKIYDVGHINTANMNPPTNNMTWDDFATYTTNLTQNLNNGVYGTTDDSTDITSFELWVRQQGRELYDRNGHLGFTQEDARSWYAFWDKLRKTGGCLPYNIQKNYDISGTPVDASIVKGKTVMLNTLSNLFDAYQKAVPTRKLDIITPPVGTAAGSFPGMYFKPSMLLSISATTKFPTTAAAYISFINNNPDALKALGVERGIPGSTKAPKLLQSSFTVSQQTISNYVTTVNNGNYTRVKVILDPPGAGKIQTLLKQYSISVASGSLSPADGAQQFFTQAQKAVS